MDLPKYRRNDIFEAIEKKGMDPEEFAFSAGGNEATLRHLPSRASFVLSGDVTAYAVRRVAGDPRVGRLVVVVSPAGFEGFFRMLAQAEAEGTLGPEAYARASERYGIEWL